MCLLLREYVRAGGRPKEKEGHIINVIGWPWKIQLCVMVC